MIHKRIVPQAMNNNSFRFSEADSVLEEDDNEDNDQITLSLTITKEWVVYS